MSIQIGELIVPERILCGARVNSKKRALECLSELLTEAAEEQIGTASEVVFDALVSRERLGSTGLGRGVALPHARQGDIRAAVGAFVSLREPIDFDAADRQPVDLLFGLTVPEDATNDHLEILATLAELLRTPEVCEQLRAAQSAEAVHKILLGKP